MTEAAETKVCPFCAETIRAAARKCPFCTSKLIRHAIFWQEFLMGLHCVIAIGIIVFVCAWIFPDEDITEGRSFARRRKDLEVKSVAVSVEKGGTRAFYYNVSGIVTNRGEYPWRVEDFELTISNSQRIADVRHEKVTDPFVVQPRAEHAFVFHCYTSLTNAVVAAQARVENARDGNVPPKDK